MYLNQAEARWLGVCAGIADWLDVPATLVRIIFVICVLSWPPLIIGYFLLYFCLDKDLTPEKMQNYFNNASTAEHFRKLDYRKPIYKNERNKRIAGVCSGIADYFEVSAFAVRAVTLLSLFIFGPFTFWAYIICMFVFDPDPHADQAHSEFKNRKRQRREERRARRHAKHEARRAGKVRKSYPNSDFKSDMEDLESEINDTVSQVSEEISDAFGRGKAKSSTKQKHASNSGYSHGECSELYGSMEKRLREVEAYMTSKRFRLHCEINRI